MFATHSGPPETAFTVYLEILIHLCVLIGNVRGEDFVCYMARTAAKLAPGPQVAPPEHLTPVHQCGHQAVCGFTL